MDREKENKLQTLRSLRLMDVPLQDRVHPQLIGLKKLYKEINYKLSPIPTTEEGWLCLYRHQGSQTKHLSNAQCTPKV